MIGGNIPEQTRVVSTQIYGHVEALEYTQAHWLSAGMVVFSFAVLLALALLNRRSARVLRMSATRIAAAPARCRARGFTLDVDLRAARAAASPRCSARRAPARPRCCVAWPAWSARPRRVSWSAARPGRTTRAASSCPTWRRPLGYVFQEASLFDHLDVRGNLRFAASARAGARGGDRAATLRASCWASATCWTAARTSSPAASASGWRSRAPSPRNPRILLLDEPLAALDAARRQRDPALAGAAARRTAHPDAVRHPLRRRGGAAGRHLVLLDAGRVRAAGPLAETLARIDLPAVPGEEPAALLHAHRGRSATRAGIWREGAFDGGALWLRDAGLAVGHAVRVRVLARDVSLALAPPQRQQHPERAGLHGARDRAGRASVAGAGAAGVRRLRAAGAHHRAGGGPAGLAVGSRRLGAGEIGGVGGVMRTILCLSPARGGRAMRLPAPRPLSRTTWSSAPSASPKATCWARSCARCWWHAGVPAVHRQGLGNTAVMEQALANGSIAASTRSTPAPSCASC